MYIQGEALTNKSLRERFNVKDSSAGSISSESQGQVRRLERVNQGI